MDKVFLLTVLQVLSLNEAYQFVCPSQAHWKLRAKSRCTPPRNYTCLFDVNFQVNVYRDKCNRPRILAPGYKYVFQPNLNRATCSLTRYQPFIFNTIGTCDCTYLKSLCNSEGQKIYKNGKTTSDRTCICNINKGYTFVRYPKNQCFCNPSIEDCSCYIGIKPNNITIDSKDLKCFGEINIIPDRLQGDALHKSKTVIKNKDFDSFKYNISCPANYRTKVAIIVLLLFLSYIVVSIGIFIFLRMIRQWIQVHTLLLPEDIKQMKEEDRNRFIKLMQSEKKEKRYSVRIMIVGKAKAGKTCLLRRLLKESIANVSSTDGVDIVIRRCKINIEDGDWTIDKDITDDMADRLQRAIAESTITDNETSIPNDSLNVSTEDSENLHIQSDTSVFSEITHITPTDVSETNEKNTIRLHDVTSSTNETKHNIETLNNIENVIGGKARDNEIDTKTLGTFNENGDKIKSSSLVIPRDLMSHVLSTTSASNIPSRVYSLCGLWDFAGQREFYATHQAFLTSSAVYLVVANIFDDITNQSIKQYFADFYNVGEYVDFWFDSIHCHRTVEPPINGPFNDNIDPPVIIVFTRKDEYEKVNRGKKSVEERKKELQTQLRKVFGNKSKYHHLRRIFWLSNTEDSDEEFEKLRLEISAVARKLNNWGEVMPLKWVLLEHLIEIIKKGGKDFINHLDMLDMAKHPDIKMTSYTDVLLFLRFQHNVGNIIFFDDIPDFIILNPQWLVNAFRCLVSDKIDDKLQHREDWIEFEQSGKISESLIIKLFESKGGSQFVKQKDHLLKVMEKFDILVKIGETGIYILPSMTPSISFDEVCKKLGVEESNCKRTSWLCLKFEFLPPAFFNHFSVWFMRNYEPSKVNNDRQSLALFRGISIFDIDKSGCEKLLVTMSTDTVALQILSFSTEDKDFGRMCNDIRSALIRKTEDIKEKYNLTICYELHFKCSKGHYYEDTMPLNKLKSLPEYHCNEHKGPHQSARIYLPWMMYQNEDKEIPHDKVEITIHQEELYSRKNNANNIPMTCYFCENVHVNRCYECSNVLCDDCFLKHDELTNTKQHTFQSANDKLLLINKFEISGRIVAMKVLPSGLLVIALFHRTVLLTYSVSTKDQHEIRVGGQPRNIAILNRNTVVVQLTHTYEKVDSIEIVDIKQRKVTRHVDINFMSLIDIRPPFFPIFCIDDKLYISRPSGIAVTDMTGTLEREISLGFKPRDMWYDAKNARIYCIDKEDKLICYDTDGSLIFTFTNPDLTSAARVTIDPGGYVLVLCNAEKDLRCFKVHRINPDGTSMEVIFTGKEHFLHHGYRFQSICSLEDSDSVVIGLGAVLYFYKYI